MTLTASENAMTEVALALAMAFFSLMVLTMVSMAAPQENALDKMKSESKLSQMKIALSAKPNQAAASAKKMPTLVVYWKGQFLNRNLQPLNLATQTFEGRVILALPPDLPMIQALEARAQVKVSNLVVSALNNKWLDRLSKQPL